MEYEEKLFIDMKNLINVNFHTDIVLYPEGEICLFQQL